MKIVEIFTKYGINIIGDLVLNDGNFLTLINACRGVSISDIYTNKQNIYLSPIGVLTKFKTLQISINDILSNEEIINKENIKNYLDFISNQGE